MADPNKMSIVVASSAPQGGSQTVLSLLADAAEAARVVTPKPAAVKKVYKTDRGKVICPHLPNMPPCPLIL